MTPYSKQPRRAFWASGVARRGITDIYRPRVALTDQTRVVCAGSCFAQHIGRQLKQRGLRFVDLEPPPPTFPAQDLHDYGFDLYSARYGNLYSVRQLVQLFERAEGRLVPTEDAWVEADGRVRDPFRPTVEPGGFASIEEMHRDRAWHLAQVARLLDQCDLFIFTFGLTEAWECRADGVVLPVCPGTAGGSFDPARYQFRNFGFAEVLEDATRFIRYARRVNPDLKFLFTVSPVPLTATATDNHVLVASMYSKSVLRAVCGALVEGFEGVDYFPSYEIVAGHPSKARHYLPDLRGVALDGVEEVMGVFFAAHGMAERAEPVQTSADAQDETLIQSDLICEEELLAAQAQE